MKDDKKDILHFICPACLEDLSYASNYNKHLYICVKYQEYLKSYKPPIATQCESCELYFISLDFHHCQKKRKIEKK